MRQGGGPQRIEVGTSPPYTIRVGKGILGHLSGWLAREAGKRRGILVTDSHVAGLHAPAVAAALDANALHPEPVVFPAGEESKTRRTKEMVEDSMIDAGMGRDAILIALGGGVVTDLAGFTAATFMRGVPWVAVPTTLLAMVDASIGGKTGVDHPKGKNLIGAFHQPSAVFIDIDFLDSLPDDEYRSGLAEVVKAGIIRDESLFRRLLDDHGAILSRDAAAVIEVISAACRIKAEVVADDEKEGDLRKILNFGHTVGHALERLSGYRLGHGQAVSIGMVIEARLAVRLGLLAEEDAAAIEKTLSGLGLPTRIPGPVDAAGILEACRSDKKARGGRIVCALPSAIGRMASGPAGYGIEVEEGQLLAVLGESSGVSRSA